jgi:hypothetical protein
MNRWIQLIQIVILVSSGTSIALYAKDEKDPYQLNVQVARHSEGIHTQISYIAPLNACNAFAYLTDYAGAKQLTGIQESKVVSKDGNVVFVERVIQERVLGFPVEMHSLEKYVEQAPERLTFEQVQGDAKFYKGTWILIPDNQGTRFEYESDIELNTFLPRRIVEYILHHNIQERFSEMAKQANDKAQYPYSGCSPNKTLKQ